MFVARASVLLDTLDRYHHDLAAGLRAIAADPSRLDEDWAALEKIAIDHAIAEPAAADGLVAVVPASLLVGRRRRLRLARRAVRRRLHAGRRGHRHR